MSYWERISKSDEWYTPKYIFDALQCEFDVDVAAPIDRTYCHVPAKEFITENSLTKSWKGFIWMNAPFGKRNGLEPWLTKISKHHNGIALVPDRTSAPWWQTAAKQSDALLFINHKVKFIKPDGSIGASPSAGTVLLAYGRVAVNSLATAEKNMLGILFKKFSENRYRMNAELPLFCEPPSNYNLTRISEDKRSDLQLPRTCYLSQTSTRRFSGSRTLSSVCVGNSISVLDPITI